MKFRSAALAAVSGAFAILLAAAPALATLDTVSASAYGEKVHLVVSALVTVDSGPLPTAGPIPSSGGSSSSSLASVCVPGGIDCSDLQTSLLSVSASGTTGASGSVASDADVLNVSALNGLLTANAVDAHCAVNSDGATSGDTTLTSAQLGGVALSANPGPNTTLNVVVGGVTVGTVTLNEQTYDGGTNTLTVNGIHIHLTVGNVFGTGDIIVSHVECDATPAGPAPVIPESSLAILLPATALIVAGGMLVLTIRRRSAFERG